MIKIFKYKKNKNKNSFGSYFINIDEIKYLKYIDFNYFFKKTVFKKINGEKND